MGPEHRRADAGEVRRMRSIQRPDLLDEAVVRVAVRVKLRQGEHQESLRIVDEVMAAAVGPLKHPKEAGHAVEDGVRVILVPRPHGAQDQHVQEVEIQEDGEGDTTRMRDDNVGDYPWLLFALETLMREYARLHDEGDRGAERQQVVEGLLNGLTCDPWAFVGKPPDALKGFPEQYNSFCELLGRYGEDLLEEFKRHRPSAEDFSPLAFHFNFPHNVLTAILMIALAEGSARSLSMNAVLLGRHDGSTTEESPDEFAKALTAFAGSGPEKLDAHGAQLIIYDRHAGHGYCNMVATAIGRYLSEMSEQSAPRGGGR